jgi:hypothetical protein
VNASSSLPGYPEAKLRCPGRFRRASDGSCLPKKKAKHLQQRDAEQRSAPGLATLVSSTGATARCAPSRKMKTGQHVAGRSASCNTASLRALQRADQACPQNFGIRRSVTIGRVSVRAVPAHADHRQSAELSFSLRRDEDTTPARPCGAAGERRDANLQPVHGAFSA